MPTNLFLKKTSGELVKIKEIAKSWNLDKQIASIRKWISSNNVHQTQGCFWVVDIGIKSLCGSNNIAVQGETLPLDFMEMMVEKKILVRISIYPKIIKKSKRPFGVKGLYRSKTEGIDYDMIEENVIIVLTESKEKALIIGERTFKEKYLKSHINPFGKRVKTKLISAFSVFETFDLFEREGEVFSDTYFVRKSMSNKKIVNEQFGKRIKNEDELRRHYLNGEYNAKE